MKSTTTATTTTTAAAAAAAAATTTNYYYRFPTMCTLKLSHFLFRADGVLD